MNMPETRTAMLAVVGRPNVGKSTLINALVGEKVAIVTNKPQTTRGPIRAVLDRGGDQFIFVDTPGLHRARNRLGEYMVKVARESVADVDAVVLLVEPVAHVGQPERELLERAGELGAPVVLVINKLDTVRPDALLPVMEAYAPWESAAIVPVSARTGEGLEELLDTLEKFLAPGPKLFPEGMVTDQPERLFCAELIREKLLLCLDKEIPHGTAVEVTRFSQRTDTGVIDLEATIYCEKESHKGIIIGKGGAMLKKISTLAREEIERFMGEKVYLQTWVKVKENWRSSARLVENFGFRDD